MSLLKDQIIRVQLDAHLNNRLQRQNKNTCFKLKRFFIGGGKDNGQNLFKYTVFIEVSDPKLRRPMQRKRWDWLVYFKPLELSDLNVAYAAAEGCMVISGDSANPLIIVILSLWAVKFDVSHFDEVPRRGTVS